jgi:GTP-binding protein
MTGTIPTVAVVGRQNVGKSTLVNRLFGRRATIAHDTPGVTRDRVELEATWRGRRFGLVDTAGFLPGARGLEALAGEQAALAARTADVIVLVVDVTTGITEDDARLARRLRREEAPVVVVANKADSPHDEADVSSFVSLGLGEPVPVSALHGRGAGDLLDRLVALLPESQEPDGTLEEPRFAIVGRPNVGKSSLFNRLLGEERSVVSDVPGTTRDSVDSFVTWPDLVAGGGRVRFVDTAGMRRGSSVRSVEYYSFLRASEAIDRAHVAIVVIDAADGLTSEDKRIVRRVIDAGRALLVAANKWDLVEDKDRVFKTLGTELGPFADAHAVRVSALQGQGVHRLPPLLVDLHDRWSLRASTSKVNDILQRAQRERPTPRAAGTLHYATQVGAGPPTFVIFGGAREPDGSYRRYLENRLRRELSLAGVPIRIRFRARRTGRRSERPSGRSGGASR